MKLARLILALVASSSLGAPLEPVVNQIGRIPVRGSLQVPMKFAIVEYGVTSLPSATTTVAGGRITGVTLVSGGSNYAVPPSVTVTGAGGSGNGARIVATVANGSVQQLRVAAPGAGYRAPIAISFSAPVGNYVTSLWSNDGTSVAGSQPAQAVSLQVIGGSYAALLGSSSLEHMLPLTRAILSHAQARVRVWYWNGHSFTRVIPDAPLQTILYADAASYAEGVGNGGITASMLADGAVTTAKLAAGAVTADKLGGGSGQAGGVVVSVIANDADLLARGFKPVRTFSAPTWQAPATTAAPSSRTRATAIWTGTGLIIWGGSVNSTLSNQGAELEPLAQTWANLPLANAPVGRANHTAIWTGSKMIVWGGGTDAEPGGTATGGIFDEANQLWRATSLAGAPAGRVEHTATWAGDRMVVWGGRNPDGIFAGGASFFPATGVQGSWNALPDFGEARRGHSAIWTGSRVILWGGLGGDASPLYSGLSLDPVSGQGVALPATGAPAPRFGHSAVWTGNRMIVWGGAATQVPGQAGDLLQDGGLFDPATQKWTPLSNASAPAARFHHGAVWTGTEMIIFGGEGFNNQPVTSVAAYNPATDSWRTLPSVPAGTAGLTGIWSGQTVLCFGSTGLLTLDPSPAVYLYGQF